MPVCPNSERCADTATVRRVISSITSTVPKIYLTVAYIKAVGRTSIHQNLITFDILRSGSVRLAIMKKGYVYGFFDLKDAAEFKNVYSPMAEPTLEPYGGRFVMKHALPPPMAAKMGMKESKGFGKTGQMAFMLEFDTFEKAMGWFTGPEYAAVLKKRDEVSDFNMAVVEGLPDQLVHTKAGMVVGFFDMKDPR